ncbi:type VI secretion system contractile sheath small subunit [Pantoea sp. B65]|uniref:type VI secretion system contractile sheath small subunit n=1 Tax=Pantoea sp. B65 TaxID=2813359 RepID=UPI0039B42268
MPINKSGGQKFIARNRAPRVQIEYDVEVYGAERKIQLPFVMGVISDLAGRSGGELPALDQRKFVDIDSDNFDERMKSLQPRVVFQTENTLGGEGQLHIDLTFNSLDDFSPDAVARNVTALSHLLDARTQLSNLLSYMDGKNGAEQLIANILQDAECLKRLSELPESSAALPPRLAGEE